MKTMKLGKTFCRVLAGVRFSCPLMKAVTLAAILFFGATATSPSFAATHNKPSDDAHQPPAQFSVVQWNIGHFALGKASRTAIAPEESAARSASYKAMIDKLKPDFLGVSEFDPIFDKAGRLSTNEVFSSFPTKILGPKNNYQCNALFTRFPCVRHEVVNYTLHRQNVYFIDSVFMFGTNEVHFVQSHLDWYRTKDGERYALPQMQQLVTQFQNVPYVIISADFNVSKIEHFAAFLEAGYVVANDGRYAVLDNIVVKGFNVKELFAADNERRLSDHRIVGCLLEMQNLKTDTPRKER
ncbi:MAG: endonuclease/exonuclease/phosphatase family protein [Kiritimatiellae bacterium]|nr:endonuclease/exonuclease/phosphatase family protein [Kiritimatiellia bacterium]